MPLDAGSVEASDAPTKVVAKTLNVEPTEHLESRRQRFVLAINYTTKVVDSIIHRMNG
jgi:hypothetical protein